MTGPEQVPGQLGIIPDAADLEDAAAAAAAEVERLDTARLEYRASALARAKSLAAGLVVTGVALDRAVAEARALGATWQQIADAVGMTRQSAHERWSGR